MAFIFKGKENLKKKYSNTPKSRVKVMNLQKHEKTNGSLLSGNFFFFFQNIKNEIKKN